ncbi:DsrE/DsrF/DrsH-like family protein [Streptomyces umbrinus]|uniref:DsrE/DsrF/DrsH-like family protein n=1 Tax=Streptomyces umbrinus TaxID=67370 RepID=UPI0033C77289
MADTATIEKVSIIVSKGSLEGVYPALIMANGARAEGIEADLFFTFFGLDAITKKRWNHIKLATVGNPGLHLPTLLGGLPGVPDLITRHMERRMQKLDIPSVLRTRRRRPDRLHVTGRHAGDALSPTGQREGRAGPGVA